MPRYTLSGVDREDGGIRFATIQADSQDDAINKAGFVVERVEQVPEPTPADRRPPTPPPSYPSIAIYSTLFIVLGYVLAILGFVAAVFAFLPTEENEGLRFSGGVFAIYTIPTGLGIALLGELLRGFRDMARNSFR